MTDLRVMKSGNITWTNVDVDKNVIITNRYNIGEQLKYGEVQAEIQDGNVQTKRNGNGKTEEILNFNRLSLSEKKYTIFMEVCKLDGNASNFTQSDAILATQLNKKELKNLGITQIIKDFTKGVIQIVLGEGKNDVITFDFETEKELQNRKGSYTVPEKTNAFDLAHKLQVDAMDLLDANPEYHTHHTLSTRNGNSSGDSELGAFESVEIPAGVTLNVPIDTSKCWDNKY